MQPLHVPSSTFTHWSEIPPNSDLAFLGHAATQMSSSSTLCGVHHPTGSSALSGSSEDSSGAAFADACMKTSVSPPPSCVFQTCVGGSLASDGTLKPCSLRLRHRGEDEHQAVQLSRGCLCTTHHLFIQCTGCEHVVHEGCWASECMLPSSRNPWTCDECAKKTVQVANASATALKSETDSLPKQACEEKKVTVLFKSRDSIMKIFTKEGFRCRSSGAFASGLKWLKFDCISPGCNIQFKCSETANDTWNVTDLPETHPCCASNPVTNYHQRTRTLPDECLQIIQKLATSGAFDSKSIQKHLHSTHGWNVATDLIYMIGYRARAKMFGGDGCSDTAHLVQQQEERRALGDIYDLHYSDKGNLTHIVWVSSFAHLLLAYFDYFLCDGTHGISKYGWKFMPLCIVSSGDWIFPFAAVFGLEESAESLKLLHAAIRRHCLNKGVPHPPFGGSPKPVPPPYPVAHDLKEKLSAWAKVWLRSYLYPLEWEPYIALSTIISWQSDKTSLTGWQCEKCGELGHNAKWCPKARKDHVSQQELHAYFEFLSIAVSDEDLMRAAIYASVIFKQRCPTLHTDGGSAFGPLCQEVDRERTSCAIHMESKVASCNADLKSMVKRFVLTWLWYICVALAVVYTSGL